MTPIDVVGIFLAVILIIAIVVLAYLMGHLNGWEEGHRKGYFLRVDEEVEHGRAAAGDKRAD